jgi:hypothetical protein
MTDLLFATPWWLLGTLIIVACVVFWTGQQKQKTNPRIAGVGLILLAFALYSLRFFVETDKEKCEKQTLDFVKSVEKHDWQAFTSLLDDQASLGTSMGTIYGTRQSLIDGAKANTEKYNPTNVGSHIANIEQDATGVTVDVDVSAEASISLGYRVPTSWKLMWQRSGKDWKLHEITCTKIGNDRGNDMARDFAK